MHPKPPIAKPSTPLLDQISNPADLRELSDDALRTLANELREEVISAVSVTGGHLGAGLGVVELTVALHYVFDTPKDRLIWDVGHQAYPHKVLTGRRERIRTLRQPGGLSGFTKRSESEYDPFGTAHSSTSISAALGMAIARDLNGDDNHVVAVIGDGAMSAGMAYEAINNAGALNSRLIVILNDNGRSIAEPVGAMSSYLSGLADNQKPETLFSSLGFDYFGPIDGHNLDALLPTLRNARDNWEKPVLIHCLTQKGKGYKPAESAEDKYHGVSKFDIDTGAQVKAKGNVPSYTKVYANALIEEAGRDEKIIGITAAMPSGTGMDLFGNVFPNRMFDVGIAEQHAVTFAAGLATEGYKPFCAIYSTFLQRAYDQVVHDVAVQNLPVRFAIDRAGYVGADGPTHAGSFDTTFLATLPNFVVMAPSDEAELMHMVATAAALDAHPCSFRYPRGEGVGVDLPKRGEVLEIGRGRVMREGSQVALLTFGSPLYSALAAAEELETNGISCTVADARFAKPLDKLLIKQLAQNHEALIVIEEGSIGGFSAHTMHYLSESSALDSKLKVRTLAMPDTFMDHNKPEEMIRLAGLEKAGIVAKVSDLLQGQS